jgi:hypothetical protein
MSHLANGDARHIMRHEVSESISARFDAAQRCSLQLLSGKDSREQISLHIGIAVRFLSARVVCQGCG